MIVDKEQAWTARFESGWLKNFIDEKSINWKLYSYVKNERGVSGKGIALSEAKVLLVSSAGAYLPSKDKPFNAANLLGDYSVRTFPTSTPLENLEYAHDHYDQTSVREDAQVLLPLTHLQEMVKEGIIGSLSDMVVSFMGYQPWVGRVIKKTIPSIKKIIDEAGVNAVLLVPS